jgi:hypothetical protein
VVVAGQWTAALMDEKVGIPDRLGCNPPSVCRSARTSDVTDRVKAGYRVFTNVTTQTWSTFVDQIPTLPLILVGGIDLLRVARLYDQSDDGKPVEFVTIGTMPEASLEWWFEGSRALHFKSPDAISAITRATGGVPLLVGALDQLLTQPLASDVSHLELQTALEQLENDLPAIAQSLVNGSSSIKLTSREIELLKMVHRVGEDVDNFDLQSEFADYWECICSTGTDGASIRPPMTDRGDHIALQVLLDVGLLTRSTTVAVQPRSVLGRVMIDINGVAARLVRAVESIHVG